MELVETEEPGVTAVLAVAVVAMLVQGVTPALVTVATMVAAAAA